MTKDQAYERIILLARAIVASPTHVGSEDVALEIAKLYRYVESLEKKTLLACREALGL